MPSSPEGDVAAVGPGLPGRLVVPPPPPPPPPPLLCGPRLWRRLENWRRRDGGRRRRRAESGPRQTGVIGPLRSPGRRRRWPSATQLSDDIPFRVNWPGTEFSLVQCPCEPGSHLSSSWHLKFSPFSRSSTLFSPRTSSAGACFIPSQSFINPAFVHSYSKCLSNTFCGCASMRTHSGSSGHLFSLLKKSVSPVYQHSPPVEAAFLEPRQAHLFSLWQVTCSSSSNSNLVSFKNYLHPSYTISCTVDMSSLSYSFSLSYMHNIHIPHSSLPSKLSLRKGCLASEMLTTLCRMSFTVLMYYNHYLRLQNMRFYGQFSYTEKRIYNLEVMNICSRFLWEVDFREVFLSII